MTLPHGSSWEAAGVSKKKKQLGVIEENETELNPDTKIKRHIKRNSTSQILQQQDSELNLSKPKEKDKHVSSPRSTPEKKWPSFMTIMLQLSLFEHSWNKKILETW